MEEKTMIPKTGYCEFCGQSAMIEFAKDDVSQETVNEEATRQCTCPESRTWRDYDNNKRAAMGKVETILHGQPERISILKKYIEANLQFVMDTVSTSAMFEKAVFMFDDCTVTISVSGSSVTVKKRVVKEVKL